MARIQARDSDREKMMVALSSVVAAIGLTGLDLVAALMTLFAVRVASRPADGSHH